MENAQPVLSNSVFQAFKRAVAEIFQENGISLEGQTDVDQRTNPLQVVAAVGVTGDLKGTILFGCSYPSAQAIVGTLFASSNIIPQEKSFGDLAKATIGEFANQIAGRSLMNLSQAAYDCNMPPPTVLTGDVVTPDLVAPEQEYVSRLTGGFGSALFRVGIKSMKKLKKEC